MAGDSDRRQRQECMTGASGEATVVRVVAVR